MQYVGYIDGVAPAVTCSPITSFTTLSKEEENSNKTSTTRGDEENFNPFLALPLALGLMSNVCKLFLDQKK